MCDSSSSSSSSSRSEVDDSGLTGDWHCVCRLSRRGMTVILSIHQPRYSIYKLFDTLMLLHDGECVYHGPAADALKFFASAGVWLTSAFIDCQFLSAVKMN